MEEVVLSNLYHEDGYDHPLNDEIAWRVFEVNAKDIKVLYADTFRRVHRATPHFIEGGVQAQYSIQWKPTVVIQAGTHRLTFLDISILWRFTNAVIYPERYSFSDFKGIVEMFLPVEFFEAILSDSTHSLSINAQRNVCDEWIVTGVEKYNTILPNYQEIGVLVQDRASNPQVGLSLHYVEPPVSARFVNNDTCLYTWGRKEIEIRNFKGSFVVSVRYYHTTHIVQPIEAKEVRGSLASVHANTLIDLLDDAIHALDEATRVCFSLGPDDFSYGPMTGTLTFKDRNRLEHERWLEMLN